MPRDTIIQDNARETKIAEHIGITPSQQRAGDDALDAAGNPYELKSATKDSVTTARDVSVHTIRGWRKQYWVVAQGSKNPTSGDFEFTAIWVIHPRDLEVWFSKWEKILRAEERRCNRVLRAARAAGAAADDVAFVAYVCERGVTRNNPKIPIKLIKSAGTPLDPNNPATAARQLRAFAKSNPLPAGSTKGSSAASRRRLKPS